MTTSPSPFSSEIPHLQLAWDSTSISLLQECAYKYFLSMILQFHPKGTSIHLAWGGAYASVQEHYRKALVSGVSYEEAVFSGVRECLSFDDRPYADDAKNFPYKNRHTLARTFQWYTEQYRHDPFETYQLSDGSAAAELSFRIETGLTAPGGDPFLLCGHLDLFGSFQGDYYFKDDKTTKSALTDLYFSSFNPNTQMTNYFVATKALFDKPAQGGIVDAAQVLVNGTRFSRRFITRTEGQIEEWHHNLAYYLQQAIRHAETGHWPQNTNACGNFGGCPFRPICARDPSVRLDFLKLDYEHWEWNPLEIRGD